MKKHIFLILSCLFLLHFTMTAYAQENIPVAENENPVRYQEDGSYIVTTIQVMPTRSANMTQGSKTCKYYDQDGTLLWMYTIAGEFEYTGSSSKCTDSADMFYSYSSNWSCSSHSVSHSGNQVRGNAVAVESNTSGIVKRVPSSLTLTCDSNGNLS